MIQGTITITSPLGIHARPAALIASSVLKSESEVTIRFNGKEIDPGNYIKLMTLGAKCGDEIEVIVEGSDENEIFAEITQILQTT